MINLITQVFLPLSYISLLWPWMSGKGTGREGSIHLGQAVGIPAFTTQLLNVLPIPNEYKVPCLDDSPAMPPFPRLQVESPRLGKKILAESPRRSEGRENELSGRLIFFLALHDLPQPLQFQP